MTDLEAAKRIAELTAQRGGRAYFVGGFVRDELMGCKDDLLDIDIEVHGVKPEELREILSEVGEVLQYGSSFGIYGLSGHDIDIAMPRKEHATGRGHRDFEVFVDPFIGPGEAARRRDFTINAMMQDVLSGEDLDPFGGQKDLEKGVLRHVDDKSFAEDPLRVLRCAQFAARFTKPGAEMPENFTVAPETIALCRSMDLSALSRERVEGELKKALLKAAKPSVFFEVLRQMDQLGFWFAELGQLIGLAQDPVYHPEGDVWVHSMQVLDRAALCRDKVSEPYRFMLLALLHDLGKITATEEVKGRIHAYGHETKGLPLIEEFLRRITGEEAVISYVLNMAALHMKPNMSASSGASVKSTNRMFDEAADPRDLVYMALCDKPVMSGSRPFTGDPDFLFGRLKAYEDTMAKPYVAGRDLVEAGLKPGQDFSELLSYAHKLRLAGIDKKTALKQVLSMAKKRGV